MRLTTLLFVAALATAAIVGRTQPIPAGVVPVLGPPSRDIPRPAELQRDVDFWIRAYSEITTQQGFLHDEADLAIVYGILNLPSAPAGSLPRRNAVSFERERWRSALRTAAEALESGTPTHSADAQRVLDLWGEKATPGRLRAATETVRFQLGQADRFRDGLVRSGTWETHIARTFERLGLPPELAALPHVESSFTPTAYSKVGAAGLWQFMPGTARLYMRVDDVLDERMDPFRATEAAAKLLLYNYRVLGSWPLAITAYNHGAAGMRRARDTLGTDDFGVIARRYKSKTFGFASRNFYPSFLAALTIDQNPERYFGKLERAPALAYQEIEMPAYASVEAIESGLGLDRRILKDLNPALRPSVWTGSRRVPRGYQLRLPANLPLTAAEFADRLGGSALHANQVRPNTHRVGKGETLSGLARRYGVRLRTLAELNGLRVNSHLRQGQRLLIPDGAANPSSRAAAD